MYSITNANSDNGVATVSQLWLAGTYVFEVKAIDDRADWSLDTVNVVIGNGRQYPYATYLNAGTVFPLLPCHQQHNPEWHCLLRS